MLIFLSFLEATFFIVKNYYLVFPLQESKLGNMNIKEYIRENIFFVLKEENISFQEKENFSLERPKIQNFGDFSTNIALILAKKEKKDPRIFAEEFKKKLEKRIDGKYISSIQIEGPGFLNFFLSKNFFLSELEKILEKGDQYGKTEFFYKKRILIEHSSPNLFKPFHIGHMMNNAIGEALVRILSFSRANVHVISYPSDISLGIGKAVWRLLKYGINTLNSFSSEEEKVAFLGKCYVEGVRAMKENPEIEPEIREITQKIYSLEDGEVFSAYKKAKEINLSYFLHITSLLGSKFDDFIFESEAGRVGKDIVLSKKDSIFQESNAAIVFSPSEEEKEKYPWLHTRVFLNKDGNPTYEAKDLGLLKLKFSRYNPDLSIFVTDSEQSSYFKVVSYVASKINKEWSEKTLHITHGRMTFKGEKMSSRLGNTPLVSDILEVVRNLVSERSVKKLSIDEENTIAISALKYNILKSQIGKQVNFDPDRSLSFEGDSGPYLQYTYARAKSLLRKSSVSDYFSFNYKGEPSLLERVLIHFPFVVEEAQKKYAPHLIVNYVTELAQVFNSWYGKTHILKDDELLSHRIALVSASAQVIKNALWLLGINVLEEM